MKHHDLANTKGNENTFPADNADFRRKKSAVICKISGKYFQMKKAILLVAMLGSAGHILLAQKKAATAAAVDTVTISPAVGPVIDSAEKVQHGIFPYYSNQTFISGVFYCL